jgi:hypothetical protein
MAPPTTLASLTACLTDLQERKMNSKIDDSDFEQLACEIEKDHRAVLAGNRSSIEHAISAGARLEKARQNVGHGAYEQWIKDYCTLKASTARLYHRLYRRLDEMPEMKEKILASTLNEADELLERERERQMFSERLKSEALNSALCETAWELADVVHLAKKRVGDAAWDAWDDPIARFVKPLANPPRSLCFPLEFKRPDESS